MRLILITPSLIIQVKYKKIPPPHTQPQNKSPMRAWYISTGRRSLFSSPANKSIWHSFDLDFNGYMEEWGIWQCRFKSLFVNYASGGALVVFKMASLSLTVLCCDVWFWNMSLFWQGGCSICGYWVLGGYLYFNGKGSDKKLLLIFPHNLHPRRRPTDTPRYRLGQKKQVTRIINW